MGLIALRSHNEIPSYKELLSDQRWQRLADMFREEVFALYQVGVSMVKKVTNFKSRPLARRFVFLEPVFQVVLCGYFSSLVSLLSPCAFNVA